jgi:glycogen phosphorylase
MEYGLGEELPLYAGGLGILAGDHLKAAGGLGVPLTGIGILWRAGYSRQSITANGTVADAEDARDLNPYLEDTGRSVSVSLWGREVSLKIHRVIGFGTAPLYLLDPAAEEDRFLTRRLYGGPDDHRVAQEIILGVGGMRALDVLGIQVDVHHLNEGHGVFGALELVSREMSRGRSFEDALHVVRERVVFTTHTPVEAGNETHSPDLLLAVGANLGLTRDQIVRIGGDRFNMTVASLRLARAANAVSSLHAETATRMWQKVEGAAPLIGITNGVHTGTWQDPSIAEADTHEILWSAHQTLKRRLLREVEARTGVQLPENGLLVGFARRFAGYKRSDLILRDSERIQDELASGRLSLLFAGKAHPADEVGQETLRNLLQLVRKFPKSVAFLPNYGMSLAKLLTRGCDLWLNNPRRPLEACGTSGMKAAMNGVLNLSVLDGWWAEACVHGVNGWQIGDGTVREQPELQDAADLASLYDTLLEDVLPIYRERPRWTRMMESSIATAKQGFSAERMVLEYYDELYSPRRASALAAG